MKSNEFLDNLIIGRVDPHIYAFTTETIPNYLKVGDTYRPVYERINEWKQKFPNLKREEDWEWSAKIDNNENPSYFRDFAVHQFLEQDKNKSRLKKEDIDSGTYYSSEFFKNTSINDVNEAIEDISNSYAMNFMKEKGINKQMMMDQRDSSTMNEESFSRESLSIWTGNNKEAWLDSKKLNKRRTLLKCERKAQESSINPGTFYIVSADIARYSANTAIMVIKVLPNLTGFKKRVVYTEVIHGANYITEQAPRLKKLIQLYNPREIVIDGNGPGIGLLDAMVLPSFDAKTGEQFPAYYAFNNAHHLPPEKKAESEEPSPEYNAIIYDIKAGTSNDDVIHSNFFSQINNGTVSFLAHERIVKDKLLQTKKGQKMTLYDRRVYLLPYEMTSRLMDELNNLKLKPTGIQNQFKVDRISRSIEKDRFSALEYGLYRVKYYEDKAIKQLKKKNFKQYAFFSPGKRG